MALTRDQEEGRAHSAAARFFIRIGQVGRATEDHNQTLPLFPLPLMLDADGVLSKEAAALVGKETME